MDESEERIIMREKVLIVDDIELNREILAVALGDQYDIVQAADGERTIEILKNDNGDISAMLLDLIMPNVDGYAVLDYMKNTGLIDRIPVIVISAESTRDVEVKCLDMGVSDFVRKPFDSVTVRRRVKNAADLFMYKNHLEDKVKLQTRDLREKNKLLQAQAEKIRETNEKIVDVLGTVVEYRNLESGEHIKRVKGFTRILAEKAVIKVKIHPVAGIKIVSIVICLRVIFAAQYHIPKHYILRTTQINVHEKNGIPITIRELKINRIGICRQFVVVQRHNMHTIAICRNSSVIYISIQIYIHSFLCISIRSKFQTVFNKSSLYVRHIGIL